MNSATKMELNGSELSPARDRAAILAVVPAMPANYVDQATLAARLRPLWADRKPLLRRFDDLQRAVTVEGRHFALPISEYEPLDTFAKRNRRWREIAVELGCTAVRDALQQSGVSAAEVDHFLFTTDTGISTPNIEALVINRLGINSRIRRTPLFGLGCAGGAGGIARASDYLASSPDQIAVLLSVELCSLTFQRNDLSVANLIAAALFGDGAAAVVIGGAARARPGAPRIVTSSSVFYSDTEDMSGWEIVDDGFKIILSTKIPEVALQHVARDVQALLGSAGIERSKVAHWITHTGGPKVLDAIESALELPRDALQRSRRILARAGNVSSTSILLVLDDLLRSGEPQPGDYGVMIVVGPGFCSELVLLQW
ncbi:MAG TPA: 3-oxoacyl-[acyl-carrier-protein] synthase III C-terminal domain-containing protein [Candidatus Binataceae bacterium]